uniref:DeoR family transcriptional regulator n=1 Tax=Streptomyces clavuligerus TaxID=1901 RepID=UPI0018D0E154
MRGKRAPLCPSGRGHAGFGRRGRVEVTALASDFGVAPETIRRDLSELERRGLVRRT